MNKAISSVLLLTSLFSIQAIGAEETSGKIELPKCELKEITQDRICYSWDRVRYQGKKAIIQKGYTDGTYDLDVYDFDGPGYDAKLKIVSKPTGVTMDQIQYYNEENDKMVAKCDLAVTDYGILSFTEDSVYKDVVIRESIDRSFYFTGIYEDKSDKRFQHVIGKIKSKKYSKEKNKDTYNINNPSAIINGQSYLNLYYNSQNIKFVLKQCSDPGCFFGEETYTTNFSGCTFSKNN